MVLSKEELGKKIKEARKKKEKEMNSKYTQEMLANDVGISRSYLGDIEAGRKYPNYVLLSKISEVLEANDLLPDGLIYASSTEGQGIDLVKEESSSYNTTSKSENCLNDEELSDDEYIAVKAFLETYRQQMGRRKV